MTKNTKALRWNLLPEWLPYCSQERCDRRESCLHFLAWRAHNPTDQAHYAYSTAKLTIGKDCQEYKIAQLVLRPCGFKKGAMQIPYGKMTDFVTKVKRRLEIGKTLYYDLRSGKEPLSARQEEILIQLFAEYGIPEDQAFDRYIERYNF